MSDPERFEEDGDPCDSFKFGTDNIDDEEDD